MINEYVDTIWVDPHWVEHSSVSLKLQKFCLLFYVVIDTVTGARSSLLQCDLLSIGLMFLFKQFCGYCLHRSVATMSPC